MPAADMAGHEDAAGDGGENSITVAPGATGSIVHTFAAARRRFLDPSGEYIVGSGKLAALIPVFSYAKIQKAIADKAYDGEFEGIPVIKYEAALYGEVQKPGLGPLCIPSLTEKCLYFLLCFIRDCKMEY